MLYDYTVIVMNVPRHLSSHPLSLTLFDAAVCAGFPSPAADYAQRRINLNEHLLVNEQASFLFRVRGEYEVKYGSNMAPT